MRPGLRSAAALGAVGLTGVAVAAVRAAIVGTVVLGLWPFIVIVGRRLVGPVPR